MPCFTGAVGSRAGRAVVGSVAVAGSVAAAVAAGGGVVGAGFASTRTGAWGVAAGAGSRAGAGGATGTTRASSRTGVRAAAVATGAGWDGRGASRHAGGAGRVISRRMARTDHTGRVRRSIGRASRAMATTRRRDEAARSSGNRRGTPASLTDWLPRSGLRPNSPAVRDSPSPWASTVRLPSASLAHLASSPRVPPSQASTLHESMMALAPNSP